MRRKTYLTRAEQWDRTAAFVAAEFGPPGYYGLVRLSPDFPTCEPGPLPAELYLVRARRNHRLFRAGDVFVGTYHANDERNPIFGVSSRGYALRWYWVGLSRGSRQWRTNQAIRFLRNRTAFEWVELPGRLVGKFPTDPDVRSFVTETLRAGASERG